MGHRVYLKSWVRVKAWWTMNPKREPMPPTEICLDAADFPTAYSRISTWFADTQTSA
jgi:hypothetical protein